MANNHDFKQLNFRDLISSELGVPPVSLLKLLEGEFLFDHSAPKGVNIMPERMPYIKFAREVHKHRLVNSQIPLTGAGK